MKTHPRSTLHAVAPLGIGTADTESLLSYFCRLAVSLAVSTPDLARFVMQEAQHDIQPDFEWRQRNLSGLGESAQHWAAWLSALTGVGGLDKLTLANWSEVLSPRGLAAKRAHWCPLCLKEDLEAGRSPYFRLSWEVGSVEACHRHRVALVDGCPHCGRTHVRHHAGIMQPGWCTHCGGFLGDADAPAASPRQLWVARQVGHWLGSQADLAAAPKSDGIHATLNALILGLDGGQPARFAKRIGMAKSSVHGWLKQGGKPSLEACLAMAAHSGLSLDQVLRGEVAGWTPTSGASQLAMPFELVSHGRSPARQHDWGAVHSELESMLRLPEPISVAEAGRRLGIDDRHLYLRANQQARALGARWKQFQAGRRAANRTAAREQIRAVLPVILEAGMPVNLTSLRQAMPSGALDSVEGVFDLIREVREEFEGI